MKRFLSLVLVLTLIFALCVPAFATNGTKTVSVIYRQLKIVINGTEITPADVNGNPVEPFIINGSTYLPLRAIANAFGLSVTWSGKTNTVTMKSGGSYRSGATAPLATKATKNVSVSYRNIKLILDGEELIPCDVNGDPVEPFILLSNGTTYLPVRAMANALGLKVKWEGKTNTVYLTGEQPDAEWRLCRSSLSKGSSHVSDSTYNYSESGLLSSVKCSDGSSTNYSYNSAGLMTREEQVSGSGSACSRATREYSYNSAGQITSCKRSEVYGSVTESSVTSYTYNSLGQLISTSEDYDGSTFVSEYSYDASGNLTKKTEHDDTGAVSAELTYAYDAAGNLSSEKLYVGGSVVTTTTYSYDANNRLVQSVLKTPFTSETVTYGYMLCGR